MAFTDERLRQLKEDLKNGTPGAYGYLDSKETEQLLERLEAAEDVASHADKAPITLIECWHKTAGKKD